MWIFANVIFVKVPSQEEKEVRWWRRGGIEMIRDSGAAAADRWCNRCVIDRRKKFDEAPSVRPSHIFCAVDNFFLAVAEEVVIGGSAAAAVATCPAVGFL